MRGKAAGVYAGSQGSDGAAEAPTIRPRLTASKTLQELLSRSKGSFIWSKQAVVYKCYQSWQVQTLVACLILANFITECVQRQIDPDSTKGTGNGRWPQTWRIVEGFFSIMFSIELLINMYGSWCRPFFRHAWNYFDVLVVAIGILAMLDLQLPGPLKLVRMLRAFRVFRLFGRIESLRKILVSLRKALPGVLNAFVIMILVVCIYAVLAVDLFQSSFDDCKNSDIPSAITPRGNCWGAEYYGNFFKSLYTLFQVLTGDSWSEMGVRPYLMAASTGNFDTVIVSIFFVSFVCINGFVLLNVVVAVLLDGMNSVEETDAIETTETSVQDDDGCQDGHAAILLAPHWTKDESSQETEDLKHGNGPTGEIATLRGEMASMQRQLDTIQADVRTLLVALRGPEADGDRAAAMCVSNSSNGTGGTSQVPSSPASRVQCFVGLMS